jgi:hypothetical protein
MPTWEVEIVSTTIQSMEIEAETKEEALNKARSTPIEERGPETTHWDLEAWEIEKVDTDSEQD